MEVAERLIRAFASHVEVAAAWLFGSQARGTARRESDVDVAVLFARDPAPTLIGAGSDLAAELEHALGRPVDLVVLNRASADLVHRVLTDGVLVCDRDRAARISFEVRKRAEYLDFVPTLRQLRRAATRPR